jgi:hypothetical protein
MSDIPGSTATKASLSVGGSATDVLEVNGDHDWFAVSLTAGVQVTITVFGITLEDPFLRLRDATGTVVGSNDDIKDGDNRSSKLTFTPTASGTYYIDVGGYDEAYRGSYQVSVQPGTELALATIDTIAGYLVQGAWGGDDHRFAVAPGGTITVDIGALNPAEQNLARSALQAWSDVIGRTFNEVSSGAQITFTNTERAAGTPNASASVIYSDGVTSSVTVQISTSWVDKYGTGLNTYSYQTYLHEIGHALGLGHGGDYNGSGSYSTDASFKNDAWSTTIMSYFDQRENGYFAGQGFSLAYVATPMIADIAALQTIYGLSTTTRLGDTVYGYNSNAGGVYSAATFPNSAIAIFDSGGNDTLDYSGSSADQVINLNPETYSNVNGRTGTLSIGRGVVIENVIGGSGNDQLIGNDAANQLRGGAGADRLTGGGGADLFQDSAAGLNGDVITDLSTGDRIVITDASLASFSFGVSGGKLTYTGGALTIANIASPKLIASVAQGGGVQLSLSNVRSDFDNDGRSDVLWRKVDGTVTDWLGRADGSLFANSANFMSSVPNSWKVTGVGDFDGDGRVDLLWRNSDGTVTNWLGSGNGGFTPNGAKFWQSVPAEWKIVSTGDFNGDGRDDILWRSDSGTLTNWLSTATGAFDTNGANFWITVPSAWKIVGVGDYNGDGRDDILWRNTDGTITDWLASPNGSAAPNAANLWTAVPNDWKVVGTGDFNGDGLADILWRNNDGTVTDWLGTKSGDFTPNSAAAWVPFGNQWEVVGIGDYNGDGRDDVLWQNTQGNLAKWTAQANGGFNQDPPIGQLGLDWKVQSPDLLWG